MDRVCSGWVWRQRLKKKKKKSTLVIIRCIAHVAVEAFSMEASIYREIDEGNDPCKLAHNCNPKSYPQLSTLLDIQILETF